MPNELSVAEMEKEMKINKMNLPAAERRTLDTRGVPARNRR